VRRTPRIARRSRSVRFFLVLFLAAALPTAVALAQEALGGKFRTGRDITIPPDETVATDLYVSAGVVEVEGRVEGDLIAAGGQIRVGGTVAGDTLVTGGMVTVSGEIEGDLRVAGGQVTLEGTVGEDVLAAGGQISVRSSGEIGEDFVFTGGEVTMDGRVEGSILGTAGSYVRRGTLGGTEDVTVGRPEAAPTLADRVLGAIRRYVAVLLVGALLIWLAPRLSESLSGTVRRRPLPSVGIGILGAIGVVLLVILLTIVSVLVAALLGLVGLGGLGGMVVFAMILAILAITFALLLLGFFVADVIVGEALGALLLRTGDSVSRAQRFGAMALGVAVVVAVTSIPVIAGWVRLLLLVLGIGSVVLAAWTARRRRPVPSQTA
jgi:hypothetical protein